MAKGSGQVKVTTSKGEVMTYTQKNLVDHLIVGDSIEIEMAKLAAMRTQNTGVKDLANMLVTDHQGHLEALRKVASEHDVGREALSSDTSGAAAIRALTNLQSMAADSGFDREFVRQQIEHHKQELIAIKMFGGAAKDDDLKDDLKRATPLLERHLARARAVAAQLGMPADTTASPAAATVTPKKP
jgi:predicted outer membrane protein